MAVVLKINKEWIDEGVQKAVKEIKQNFIPRSVLDDIKSEIKFITDTNGVKHIHRDDVFKIIDHHMGKE